MLHFTKQLGKLTGTLLLLALLTGCEKEDTATEFTGKVIDLDTNQSVSGVKVDLIVGDGLAADHSFVAPEVISGSTNGEGNYKFVKTTREGQTVYQVVPEKQGYVEVADGLGKVIKPNERNVLDINIAKGSFLKLSINKASATTPSKDLKVSLSYTLDESESPLKGQTQGRESINYSAATTTAELVRGFYFKRTSKVKVEWEVTTDGTTESNSASIPLVEHDTAFYEINY